MMPKLNTALAFFITTLMVVVLVGQRLDAVWAGGSGRIAACPAERIDEHTLADAQIVRGEMMQTKPGERLKYQLCDGTIIYLDENTQVRLAAYQHYPQATQLELIQGRVILDGVADIRARNLSFSTTGAACEFVHYSWRDELDVTPFVEAACGRAQKQPDQVVFGPAQTTTRFNTFDAAVLGSSPFTPETSSVKGFYDWTGLALFANE